MAYGYVIAQITVHDADSYKNYVKLVQPTIELFGGEFLVRGGKSENFEGTPPGDRNVIIRFPSYQAAQDWYHSCLLYTSPSPRDKRQSRMPSSA